MQSKQIIELLNNDQAKHFIASNLDKSVNPFSAQKQHGDAFNITLCLQLLNIYKKAKTKLPTFHKQLLALNDRSYQQASAESIARYKTSFMFGDTLLDLTAGLGVDGIALSTGFRTVQLYDANPDMVEIGQFNLNKLGLKNIQFNLGKAEDSIATADWIYLDPDRRNNQVRKVALHHLSPNVVELLPKLKKNAKNVYIKLSPLFDIHEAIKVFGNIHRWFILAENGEVKELGVWLHNGSNEQQLVMHDVINSYHLEAQFTDTRHAVSAVPYPLRYFYVPNALLLKSSLSEYEASKHKLQIIDGFHFYTSDDELKVSGFKAFRVLYSGNWNMKLIKKVLQTQGITHLTIVSKGLKQNEDRWYIQLNAIKGGATMLYLLKGKEKIAVLAKPIS